MTHFQKKKTEQAKKTKDLFIKKLAQFLLVDLSCKLCRDKFIAFNLIKGIYMHTLLNTIKNMNQSSNLGTSANMNKLIAESIFKDLKSHGFADKDIVAVSSEILNKLTDDLRNRLEKK